ncbi:uncharacterized protein LOC117650421 [Thrips palmi]|uniref:Uncharacterized protein LOC117650421 n=1 Tax=Thrips palmi TaxID=161013 RepID=A0A6P8ZY25_THRPL|nr:uncharacterized protein LOC117650421 [Thrips palmi]
MSNRRALANCSAVNCSNKYKKGSGIIFHPFPLANTELSKKWVIAMRRANFTPTKGHSLCSEHFEDNCYTSAANGRRVLNVNAIPTKFNFPLKRPIRVTSANSTASATALDKGLKSVTDKPPVFAASPIVLNGQLQSSPVRRAFLKDHCYSLPGLQKLKRKLDETDGDLGKQLSLADVEQILIPTASDRVGVVPPSAPRHASTNPIQEHIDACVMKAVTPLEQQLQHMKAIVNALTSQINNAPKVTHNRMGKETFDWYSLMPAQPSGSLPQDEHEIQVLATRLAVNFSELPAEAVTEQYQIHYVLTQFAIWPTLPPAQQLATYRMARMLYTAIKKGWPVAIQDEQDLEEAAAIEELAVPPRVTTGKRSSPRGILMPQGRSRR